MSLKEKKRFTFVWQTGNTTNDWIWSFLVHILLFPVFLIFGICRKSPLGQVLKALWTCTFILSSSLEGTSWVLGCSVLMTVSLCCRGWLESNNRNWSIWGHFLYTSPWNHLSSAMMTARSGKVRRFSLTSPWWSWSIILTGLVNASSSWIVTQVSSTFLNLWIGVVSRNCRALPSMPPQTHYPPWRRLHGKPLALLCACLKKFFWYGNMWCWDHWLYIELNSAKPVAIFTQHVHLHVGTRCPQ